MLNSSLTLILTPTHGLHWDAVHLGLETNIGWIPEEHCFQAGCQQFHLDISLQHDCHVHLMSFLPKNYNATLLADSLQLIYCIHLYQTLYFHCYSNHLDFYLSSCLYRGEGTWCGCRSRYLLCLKLALRLTLVSMTWWVRGLLAYKSACRYLQCLHAHCTMCTCIHVLHVREVSCWVSHIVDTGDAHKTTRLLLMLEILVYLSEP